MNIRIEFRYAVLISLLMLLWLSVEFLVGLHDKYIQLHPIITNFAIIIPIFCTWRALREKRELLRGELTFKQAFLSAALIALFAAILAIPVQLVFHNIINPDFFSNMIDYSVAHHYRTQAEAEHYFNLRWYLIQSGVFTFVAGCVIALIMAWRMRTA